MKILTRNYWHNWSYLLPAAHATRCQCSSCHNLTQHRYDFIAWSDLWIFLYLTCRMWMFMGLVALIKHFRAFTCNNQFLLARMLLRGHKKRSLGFIEDWLTLFCSSIWLCEVKYRVAQTQLGSFWSLITNQSNNTRENGKVPFVDDRWSKTA
jgi:hypothetical protein